MKNILITGGAGFIGSNLTGKLLRKGYKVICVDNFTLGTKENISKYMEDENYILCETDVTDTNRLKRIMQENSIDMVYHLAANSDIQKSGITPRIDLDNTFLTTHSVLEAMRQTRTKKMFFASTSAVYGEKPGVLLSESIGNLVPVSYYGAAKLASEAFISAYSYMNDFTVTIFRFANVIGPQLTHGVIYDFIKKLRKNPKQLQILGDGTQCKPYIYVEDLIEAIVRLTEKSEAGVCIYNTGVDTATTVAEIADMVCEALQLAEVEYVFSEGNRGWKGDVPSFQFDLTKIHETGWKAKYSSNEAVRKTLEEVLKEE